MKNHIFKLHFVDVGQSVEAKRRELVALGKVLANSAEIREMLASSPQVITQAHIVIADGTIDPIPGVFRMVPAHGKCIGITGGIFLNGAIDYCVPVWPGNAQTVCFLELCRS